MKHRLSSPENGTLDIDLQTRAGETEKVLENLKKCQSGQCGCPTDEYKKLDSIAVEAGGDDVRIRLEAKAGTEINTGEVEKCLDWMKGQVERD